MAFFGKPYHYYFCTVEPAADGQFLVNFIHEGRMSVPKYPRSQPEESFLDFLRTNYTTTFTSLEYRFYE